jgi:hypothetical protein
VGVTEFWTTWDTGFCSDDKEGIDGAGDFVEE